MPVTEDGNRGGEMTVVDLRGVPMPDHMYRARDAVATAASESVLILTDQEVVVKFVPGEAAKDGISTRMSMDEVDTWRIILLPPEGEDPAAGERSRGR